MKNINFKLVQRITLVIGIFLTLGTLLLMNTDMPWLTITTFLLMILSYSLSMYSSYKAVYQELNMRYETCRHLANCAITAFEANDYKASIKYLSKLPNNPTAHSFSFFIYGCIYERVKDSDEDVIKYIDKLKDGMFEEITK